MSHAFDDILQARERRGRRIAWLGYLSRRGVRWGLVAFATTLALVLVAGFAEGAARNELGDVGFAWPWEWIGRIFDRSEPIARLTGAALVLFVGGWLAAGGVVLLRRLLSLAVWARTPLSGVLAVSRGAVDEAVRNRTVLVLLALLVLVLALQPFLSLGNEGTLLRHRIQTFLSFNGIFVAILLGAMTILFSAFTVSGDLSEKRAGDVFVKPVSRLGYLVGKWLGIVSLQAVVVTVWALLVWAVAYLWLPAEQAIDRFDRDAINNRVLIAREEIQPEPDRPFRERAIEEVQRIGNEDPDRLERRGAAALISDLELSYGREFLTIEFGEAKTYVFRGMEGIRDRARALDASIRDRRDEIVRRMDEELGLIVRPEAVSLGLVMPYADELGIDTTGAVLQLRFKVRGYSTFGADELLLNFTVNGRQDFLRFIPDEIQTYDLPATIISDDDPDTADEDEGGLLVMTVRNALIPPDMLADLPQQVKEREQALRFDPEEWLLIYYRKGGFAPNVARAALTVWVRLAFLAMLGTVTGALFSFPVAATFSLTLWVLASGGTWLQKTLSITLDGTSVAAIDQTLTYAVLPIIRMIVGQFARYGQLDAMGLLVDGQYIGWGALLWHTIWLLGVWSGIALLGGWFFFQRKEIARVQV